MRRIKQNDIEWLEFDLLADIPQLKHAILLRRGGCSKGPFESLNISFDVGDEASHVESNLLSAQQTIGISNLVWASQCHGKEVIRIDNPIAGSLPSCDGLYTNKTNIGLMIKHADCQAAIIYDPIQHAVANIHAGWRGSVHNIYAEAINKMRRDFGSKPADMIVGISPSLGPYSAQFIHFKEELPEHFHQYQIKPCYFDFWAISRAQLEACGVLSHHIEIAEIDTYANPNDYFSFRRDKITGRHGTIVSLNIT